MFHRYKLLLPAIVFSLFATSIHAQNGKVGINTIAPTSTLTVAGSFGTDYRVVTTSTIIDSTYHTILANQASGTITLTIPAPGTCTGRQYVIQNNAGGITNVVTANGSGIESIDPFILNQAGQTIVIVAGVSTWQLISNSIKSTTTPTAAGNIYTIDGTLTGNRVVTLGSAGNNSLQFRGVSSQVFISDSAGSVAPLITMNRKLGGLIDVVDGITTDASGNQVGMRAWVNPTDGTNGKGMAHWHAYNLSTLGTYGQLINDLGTGNFGIYIGGFAYTPTAGLDISTTLRVRGIPSGDATDNVLVTDANGNVHQRTINDLINNTPGVTTNIYTGDGTLTGNRTVTMGANNLTFSAGGGKIMLAPAAGSQAFTQNSNGVFGIDAPGIANGRFVVLENGNVGIGKSVPATTLQVAGSIALPGVFTGGSNRTVQPTDYVIFVNNGATNVTIMLPSGALALSRILVISRSGNSTGTITIQAAPGETVESLAGTFANTTTLAAQGTYGCKVTLMATSNTEWTRVSN